MSLDSPVEHYATLFDNHFLLQGLCLHRSLTTRAAPFHIWILCVDEAVENHLLQLDLPCCHCAASRGDRVTFELAGFILDRDTPPRP